MASLSGIRWSYKLVLVWIDLFDLQRLLCKLFLKTEFLKISFIILHIRSVCKELQTTFVISQNNRLKKMSEKIKIHAISH